jgi:hypothetical protein
MFGYSRRRRHAVHALYRAHAYEGWERWHLSRGWIVIPPMYGWD